MPSADFCPAVRPPRGALSRRSDTGQISWGKFSRLPCTVAGSTLRVLDGYGLRGKWPARPTLAPYIRFLSIDSHVCSTLPSDLASRRQPLRFANPSPPSGWVEDFHLQAAEHAQHTTWARAALRPAAGDLVLLADTSFICEPDFYRVDADRLLTRDCIQARGEAFLKSSIAPAACA